MQDQADKIPRITSWFLRGFSRYAHRYLRRSFHALRLTKDSSPVVPSGIPLIIYVNHPSWWDPLICLVLADARFPKLRHFAPIEAAMLEKYRFFQRLGFFGVERGTVRGASAFLRTSRAICQQPDAALWITAQGQFTDVRARPVRLRPGLAHLLQHLSRVIVIPLAIEYVYWEERLPEALAHFGEPIDWHPSELSTEAVSLMLETRLSQAQDALADLSLRRRSDDFITLLSGRVGVGGRYDLWRIIKSWARGRKFNPAHGQANP